MDSRIKKQVLTVVGIMATFTVFIVFFANYLATGYWIPGMDRKPNENVIQTTVSQAGVSAEEVVFDSPSSMVMTDTVYGSYLLNLDRDKDVFAFMRDMEFFDKEIVTQKDKIEAAAKELTLLVSSVNKDLRIHVINGNNEVVEGYPFEIELAGQNMERTVHRDDDQDGTIYLQQVDAGSYSLKLVEYGDYETLASNITVSVKDEIEYRVLDDVTFLLKDESQVDAKVEDTEIKDALADADKSEKTERLEGENTGFGIDVSKWNKDIDWEKVKAAGVDFAIIRCAYRGSSTGALVEDPYFKKNIEGATKAGIQVGVYFFTQAVNVTEAMEEASIAVSLVKDYPLAYPIFIDTEGAGANARAANLDVETRTDVCRTFCETVEAAGYNAGVYASKNWFNKNLDTTKLSNYYTWLAEYKGEATYEGNYEFWQYTSSGKVDGINGRVDLNVGYVGFN